MTQHPIVEAFALRLTELGFRKRAGDVFTIDLAPDILGWLGLNRAAQHRVAGEVEINPVVGVRFQEVERIVAECRGEKLHAYQPPTISTPLGYLLPEARYRAWVCTPHDAASAAADMAAVITEHALPFMRSVNDLPALCRRLEGRGGLEHQLIYRRPVAFFLAGEVSRARTLLEDTVAGLGTRTDAAAVELRRFADALRARWPAP